MSQPPGAANGLPRIAALTESVATLASKLAGRHRNQLCLFLMDTLLRAAAAAEAAAAVAAAAAGGLFSFRLYL